MAMVAMVAIQRPALGRGSYDVDEDFKKYVAAIYWVQGPSKYSLGQTSGGISEMGYSITMLFPISPDFK